MVWHNLCLLQNCSVNCLIFFFFFFLEQKIFENSIACCTIFGDFCSIMGCQYLLGGG